MSKLTAREVIDRICEGFEDTCTVTREQELTRAPTPVFDNFAPGSFESEDDKDVDEVTPPGWEKTVRGMKQHPEISNPWALAWSMKNKGYSPSK